MGGSVGDIERAACLTHTARGRVNAPCTYECSGESTNLLRACPIFQHVCILTMPCHPDCGFLISEVNPMIVNFSRRMPRRVYKMLREKKKKKKKKGTRCAFSC